MKTWVLGLVNGPSKACAAVNCIIDELRTKDPGLHPVDPSRWLETVTWITPHKGHVCLTTEEGCMESS